MPSMSCLEARSRSPLKWQNNTNRNNLFRIEKIKCTKYQKGFFSICGSTINLGKYTRWSVWYFYQNIMFLVFQLTCTPPQINKAQTKQANITYIKYFCTYQQVVKTLYYHSTYINVIFLLFLSTYPLVSINTRVCLQPGMGGHEKLYDFQHHQYFS